MQKYNGERLNSEGLANYSHLLVNISRVEVQEVRSNFENVEVRILMDDFSQNVSYTSKEKRDFVFDKDLKM